MREDEAVGAWASTTDNPNSSFYPGYYEVWSSQSMHHQNVRKLTSFFREPVSVLNYFLNSTVWSLAQFTMSRQISLSSPLLFSPLSCLPSYPLLLPSYHIQERGAYVDYSFLKDCIVDLLRKQQKWKARMELLKLLRSFVFQKPFKCVSSLVNSLRILTSNFHKVLFRIISFIFF